jgi:hypothetical protein
MHTWTEDPIDISVNQAWTLASFRWDDDKVISGRARDNLKTYHGITNWFVDSHRLRRVLTDDKISARTYATFKNKDFPGCFGNWAYAHYTPNKVLGFPNGATDGRVKWSTSGHVCRKLLRKNMRFTQIL